MEKIYNKPGDIITIDEQTYRVVYSRRLFFEGDWWGVELALRAENGGVIDWNGTEVEIRQSKGDEGFPYQAQG